MMGQFAYVERVGVAMALSGDQLGLALGLASLAGVPAALLVTFIGSRFGLFLPIASVALIQALCAQWLIVAQGFAAYLVIACVFGSGWAFVLPYFQGIAARLDRGGSVVVAAGFATSTAGFVGPAMAAMLVQPGDYRLLLHVVAAGLLLVILLTRVSGDPSRSHGQTSGIVGRLGVTHQPGVFMTANHEVPMPDDAAAWQARDNRHFLHPFTDHQDLGQVGARIIERAEGVYIYDIEGNKILDGMAGLWCVNLGYGREDLVDAATRQMRQLPYYNSFFQTAHPPAIELAERIAGVAPDGFELTFFAGSGSEANDTNIKLMRRYWDLVGQPDKRFIISRKNAYHGSTVAAATLGGMGPMHEQLGPMVNFIHHIEQPYHFGLGRDMAPEVFRQTAGRFAGAEDPRAGSGKRGRLYW